MPKFTVEIERFVLEARVVEVEATDERRARRMALKMARHADNGGEIKHGSVSEFTGGTPQGRVRVSGVWKGWVSLHSEEPFGFVENALSRRIADGKP